MADAHSPTAPHAPPRERRFLRKLLRTTLVLLVLLAALTWFAPAIIARTGLLNVVLAKVGADLNGTVTADGASLSWFGPVDLRGVRVTDADGNAALTADTVSSSRSLYQLLTDRGELGTFTVANPKLDVTVAGGTTNVEKLIEKYRTDATPARPDRTPLKVEMIGGTVVLREPPAKSEHVLSGLELSFDLPKSRAEAITLTAAATASDGATAGKLGVRAEFLDGGKLTLTAANFPIGNLAPILHRFDPTTTAAGALTADLAAAWKTEATKPPTLTVDGTASATGVRLAGTWLGPDVLALDSVSAPCKFSYANGLLAVEKSKVECDVGTLEFAGTLDPTADPETLADQTGLRLKARLDLAKLAARMPKLLRVKAGTEIRSGTLAVELNSSPGKSGPSWTGTVATSKLEATRAGQPVVWESPLRAEFTGRLAADKSPQFDKLEIRSDFLNVNARGELEAFDVAARADLGTLAAKLGEFADLGHWKLNGAAIIHVNAARQPAGGFALKGSVTCDNLLVADGATLDLREPKVIVGYVAAAVREKDGRVRLDTADVGVTAGADKLALNLLKPVADARALSSGAASVTLVGDLARWQARLGRLIGLPPDWTLGGNGTVTGTLRVDPTAYSVAPLAVNLTNAVFRMPNVLDLNERQLIAKSDELRYDRKSNGVSFTKSEVSCATVTGTLPKLDLLPVAGGYGPTGSASIQVQLDPLQRMLLLRSRDSSDAVSGLAAGKVTLDASAADRFGFTADLTVTNFALGPPAKRTWTEPTAKVKVEGAFDGAADTLSFKTARVERDGLALDGSGRIAKLSTVALADLAGTLTYDLAKVEPTLKEYLGKTAQVAGKGTKPFKLTGELAGGKPGTGTDLAKLGGEATVAWQSVKAYGFDVGPAELGATLKDGIVYMTPINATFGGGKVKLSPGASLRTGDRFLNFATGKIIDNAKLTPAACADAIGFALPAIANAAKADGTFSFDLDSSRIPFASPAATATLTGRLTVHQANVSPGPVVEAVLKLLRVEKTTVTLARDNVVPVEFKNGRVHHRDFTMTVDGVVIKTAGSVGVEDGTVKMDVEVPLSGKAAGLLPNNQRLRDALAKQSIRIPVGGTLDKPTLDADAFQGQLAKLIRDAGKEIGAGLAEDLLKKGFDKLLPPKK